MRRPDTKRSSRGCRNSEGHQQLLGDQANSKTTDPPEEERKVGFKMMQRTSTMSNSNNKTAGAEPDSGFSEIETKRMFVDAAAMKEKVRQNLTKPKHTVLDYYKKTGPWQRIARSTLFEHFTLGVIAFNAIWIAVDTDHNDAEMLLDAHPVFQVAENLFCAFFSFEWFVRFMSFRRKRDGCKDAWFVFDSFLVFSMVLETWLLNAVALFSTGGSGNSSMGNASILRIARLLRLSRMARMARLLRAMPELMVLIKGMMAATRSVFFTLCLLILIMYVFAIAFTQLCDGTRLGKDYFSGVADSMYTLLVHGALLDDVGNFANTMGDESFMLAVVFFVFSLLAALTVMNMLIGVLCEVVSAVAATEKEETLVTYVNGKLRQVVDMLDTDGDKQISKKEFVEILENIDAARALQEVGVDVVGLIDFAEFIFQDDNMEDGEEHERELSFGNFMNVVLQLRGSNNATVKDIVDLRKFVRRALIQTNTQLAKLQSQLNLRGSQNRFSSVAGLNKSASMRSSASNSDSSQKAATEVISASEKEYDETKPEVSPEEPLKPNNTELATGSDAVETVKAMLVIDQGEKHQGNNHLQPECTPVVLAARSFGGVEDGGYPVPPLPTPQAPLLRQRIQENELLLWGQRSSKGVMKKGNHQDTMTLTLQGQWHALDSTIADEALNYIARPSPAWSPVPEPMAQEEQTFSDAGWSENTPPCGLEVDQLRWQLARLGKVLNAGVNEFNKIREGLDRESSR